MCGIFGLIAKPEKLQTHKIDLANLFNSMSLKTAHRGPDDLGFWTHSLGRAFKEPTREIRNMDQTSHVVLGHRRLSILDTSSAGWQPMVSKDRRYVLTYNGEIYNYIELRDQLKARGSSFQTQTDTEVLLEGYRVWGDELFKRLTGMFAFCLVDLEKESAVLARDPFGIKPLHYSFVNGGLVFASEIKSLLCFPGLDRTANRQVIHKYLDTGELDADNETFYEAIKKLPPATFAKIDLNSPDKFISLAKYWDASSIAPRKVSWTDAVDAVRTEFLNSVRLHLRSDVPIGAALSGGIDSSAIVAAMRRLEPDVDIHTFSYIADDSSLSEEKWVDIVTDSQSTKAHKVRADQDDLLRDLDDLIASQDEPFGSTSIYAQYRVFKLAKQAGITVMLDGQGADEMFAGYRPYIASRLTSLIKQGRPLDSYQLFKSYSRIDKRAKFTAASVLSNSVPIPFRALIKRGVASRRQNRRPWLKLQIRLAPPELEKSKNVLTGHLIKTLTSTSLPGLLRYEDRNSMRFSIESRVPFLTPAMAELALSLPEVYHVNPKVLSKAVLREAMRGIVPDSILDRKDKIGFETPDAVWMTHLSHSLLKSLEISSQAIIHEFLDVDQLKQALKFNLQSFAKFEVWRIFNFVKWVELNGVR
jgi:asparagine synthase (glutamine-hydrolysing)